MRVGVGLAEDVPSVITDIRNACLLIECSLYSSRSDENHLTASDLRLVYTGMERGRRELRSIEFEGITGPSRLESGKSAFQRIMLSLRVRVRVPYTIVAHCTQREVRTCRETERLAARASIKI